MVIELHICRGYLLLHDASTLIADVGDLCLFAQYLEDQVLWSESYAHVLLQGLPKPPLTVLYPEEC